MNRKYITLLILSLAITNAFTFHTTSNASSNLQSKGRIVYDMPDNEGEDIVIDSADLTYLDNNIDALQTKVSLLENNIPPMDSIGTDVNGMTLHDKLNHIIANGSGGGNNVTQNAKQMIYIGENTSTSTGAMEIDCKIMLPNYKELTADDFWLKIPNGGSNYSSDGAQHNYHDIVYNAETGILNINVSASGGGVGWVNQYKVYCYTTGTVAENNNGERQFILGSVNDIEKRFMPYRNSLYEHSLDTSAKAGTRRYVDRPYDLTDVSKIKLYCYMMASHTSTTNTTYFAVTTTPPTSYADITNGVVKDYKSTNSELADVTMELDVSALSGEYYIGIGLSNSYDNAYTSRTVVYGIEFIE